MKSSQWARKEKSVTVTSAGRESGRRMRADAEIAASIDHRSLVSSLGTVMKNWRRKDGEGAAAEERDGHRREGVDQPRERQMRDGDHRHLGGKHHRGKQVEEVRPLKRKRAKP